MYTEYRMSSERFHSDTDGNRCRAKAKYKWSSENPAEEGEKEL